MLQCLIISIIFLIFLLYQRDLREGSISNLSFVYGLFNKQYLMQMMKLEKIVQKLNRLALIERKRYEKKGITNTIIGCFLMLGMMWLALTLGKQNWPEDIQNKEMFIFVGSILIYYIIQTVGLITYLPAYLGLTQRYDHYKIQALVKHPLKIQKNISVKPELYMMIIKKLIINQLIILPIAVFLVHKNKISVQQNEFPSFKALFLQIQFMNFTQDLIGFLAHRLSHSVSSFSKMHKIHHDFTNQEWWVSEYFHALEPACSSYIMSLMLFVLTGNKVHCFVIFFWICWKNMVNTQNHAGYQFQWSPTRVMPFVAGPSYHIYHHNYHMENYAASCYVWDIFLDTNTYYMNKFLES